jgi:hypothetical protein
MAISIHRSAEFATDAVVHSMGRDELRDVRAKGAVHI